MLRYKIEGQRRYWCCKKFCLILSEIVWGNIYFPILKSTYTTICKFQGKLIYKWSSGNNFKPTHAQNVLKFPKRTLLFEKCLHLSITENSETFFFWQTYKWCSYYWIINHFYVYFKHRKLENQVSSFQWFQSIVFLLF